MGYLLDQDTYAATILDLEGACSLQSVNPAKAAENRNGGTWRAEGLLGILGQLMGSSRHLLSR